MCFSRNWRRSHSACWGETSNGASGSSGAHVALADLGQLDDPAVLLDQPREPAEGDEVPHPPERVLQPGREQLVEVELGDELVRAQSPALLDRAQEAMGVAEAGRGDGAHRRDPIGALDGARDDRPRAPDSRAGLSRRPSARAPSVGFAAAAALAVCGGSFVAGAAASPRPASSWPRAPAASVGVPRGSTRAGFGAAALGFAAEPRFAAPGYARRPSAAAGFLAVAGGAGFVAAGFLRLRRSRLLRRRGLRARASRPRASWPPPASSPAPRAWPAAPPPAS